MNFFDQLAGFAFCMIRPGVALSLIPLGNDGALGLTLRVPLVLMFAAMPRMTGWPADMLQAGGVEVLIGLLLGLLLGVAFHAASAAGALLDQQGGYTIGAVYDPNFQQESSLFETLFMQFAILTFFTGHGIVGVSGFFVDAWSVWPPGDTPQDGLARLAVTIAETRLPWAFTQSLQLAGPLLGVMLIADLSLGLASRHAKRLNPFSTARMFKAMILSFAAMMCAPAMLERLGRIVAAALNLS
ncbi:MAG: flagellar biosynthetic protein FliR [Paraburkholderia sp.]|uniref:EscT/YscT/HrcT family type III secretion system export apparatus protein n=1 Tax=Paraburkholderia sp. TaxID=1926495 RepID=UPI003C60335B